MDFLGTMDLRLLAVIIGILFISASAILSGILFYWMRSREEKRPRPPQRQSPSGRSVPSLPAKKERKKVEKPLWEQFATLSEADRQASAAPMEVMRVLRDRVTGAIVVEVEGKRYRLLREIKDERVGRLVLQAAADLVRFTEVLRPQNQTGPQQQPHPSSVEPTPADSSPSPSTLAPKVAPAMKQEPPVPRTPAPPSVEREFLESLTQQMRQEDREPKMSLSPIEFFRRGFASRRTAKAQSNASPRSFVEEIEDILQRFILTYPTAIGKEVHVGTSPEGGIRIRVENEFYDTPDDIPDLEIRRIIKAAIQEWEKS